VKPIDIDKTGIGYILQKNTQTDALAPGKSTVPASHDNRSGDQLVDLLSVIRNAMDPDSTHNPRIELLKMAFSHDTYMVDLDLLAENVMAFEL